MHASVTLVSRSVLTLILLSITTLTHATEDDSYVSAMRYVSLDASGDNADSRQYSGTGSVALGKYTWLQGTLGNLADDSPNGLGDLRNFGIGTGIKGEHLQLSVNFSNYKNDERYRQRDITAALDWYDTKFSLGLDLSHRNTDNSYDFAVTDTYPVLGTTTLSTHTDEQLVGNGVGVHGSLNLTDRLSLSLGGMHYSYDQDVAISANVSAAQFPAIAQILEKRINALIQDGIARRSGSNLTRAVVPLDSSYNVGVSYVFDSIGLSAQYLRDKNLDSDVVTDTLSLSASIFVGDHWIVAPTLGQSNNDVSDAVAFGGLSVSYNW